MKKTVALALGSGGARGLAQIGVIHELENNGFEIVAISGTSIGSLIGGLYANGQLQKFENWISNLDRSGIYDLVDFTLSSQGFVKGDRVFNEMKKFIPTRNIEELPIPYAAVTADLTSRKEVQITHGDLFKAIRASVAVPSVLTPVENGDDLYVDGGVVNPLPITALPKVEADLIIAVDLNGPQEYIPIYSKKTKNQLAQRSWSDYINDRFSISFSDYFFSKEKKKNKLNYFEIVNNSFDMMQDKLTEVILAAEKPDILIQIPRTSASTFEFHKADELIAYGKQALNNELNKWSK